jgi:5-methylcytosine-specific restriction endonuclease McrA
MNPKKPRKLCLNCNKEVATPQAIYCCQQCQIDKDKSDRVARILVSGDVSSGWAPNSVAQIKSWLIEIRSHTCELCKNTLWCGLPIPLVMDHKDGNANNWRLENLRLICGNCDMQQPTYKNKNKGNGRRSRLERYKQGKSY